LPVNLEQRSRVGFSAVEWDRLVSTADRAQERILWTAVPALATVEALRRLKG
jgi:hypothetical protein